MKAGTSRGKSISLWTGWRNLQRAKSLRRQGRYDRETLKFFADAVRGGWLSQPQRIVAYLQFRRDLGYLPPRAWLQGLMDQFHRLGRVQRQGVLRLVAECWPERLPLIGIRPGDLAGLPPGVARLLAPFEHVPSIAIDALQLQWRAEFSAWLNQHRDEAGICVVGNAASLGGRGYGQAIDAHGAVVRFNHYSQTAEHRLDVGGRTDVWVCSPGYRGPVPEEVKWVIMTGPDVRYTLRTWDAILPLLETGARILTVPLPIWRDLVRELRAPPSAGLLLLSWLREMGVSQDWRGLATAGIGSGLSATGAYHLGIPGHKADGRHQWQAESLLVAQWESQGLLMLSAADRQRQGEMTSAQMSGQRCL